MTIKKKNFHDRSSIEIFFFFPNRIAGTVRPVKIVTNVNRDTQEIPCQAKVVIWPVKAFLAIAIQEEVSELIVQEDNACAK